MPPRQMVLLPAGPVMYSGKETELLDSALAVRWRDLNVLTLGMDGYTLALL